MDFKDIIRMALDESSEDLARALDGLTQEERRHLPSAESNHVDFIVWHAAKAEDDEINSIIGQGATIWTREGWGERLGIPIEGDGYGMTAEEARDLPTYDPVLLQEYADSVRQETLDYLETTTPEVLDETRDAGWRVVKIGNALSHLVVEIAEHVGHVAYIRGMLRGLDK